MNVEKLRERREIRERFRTEFFDDIPTCTISPLPNELLESILRSGLTILGGRGTGKSNVAKVINAEIIRRQNGYIQCKIVDKVANWVRGFEPILYQNLDPDTEEIYFGDDHILFNAHFRSRSQIKQMIGKMVGLDYELQWKYKEHDVMDNWILYTIEEAQNILGRYGLTGKQGEEWMVYISEGRNFNMNFIFIGQRAADIATQAIERCEGYFFGRMSGDNDLKKIARICGKDQGIHEIVPTLGIGEFIYWNGERARKIVDVPLYEPTTVPVAWNGRNGI